MKTSQEQAITERLLSLEMIEPGQTLSFICVPLVSWHQPGEAAGEQLETRLRDLGLVEPGEHLISGSVRWMGATKSQDGEVTK